MKRWEEEEASGAVLQGADVRAGAALPAAALLIRTGTGASGQSHPPNTHPGKPSHVSSARILPGDSSGGFFRGILPRNLDLSWGFFGFGWALNESHFVGFLGILADSRGFSGDFQGFLEASLSILADS